MVPRCSASGEPWRIAGLACATGALLAIVVPGLARADLYQRADAFGVMRVALGSSALAPSARSPSLRAAARSSRRLGGRQAHATSDPSRHVRYEPYLREAAELYALPVDLLRAVVRVESNFDPNVVSRKGAVGLMQLMPFNLTSMGVADGFEPHQNILGGARLLRKCANEWGGDLVLTLASYNAGVGAVQRYRGVPPFRETRSYVRRVLLHYRAYRAGRVLSRR